MVDDVRNEIDAPPVGNAGKSATMDGVAGVVTGATTVPVTGPTGTMTGTAAGVVAGAVITDATNYNAAGDPTVTSYDDTVSDPNADEDIAEVRGMGDKAADFVISQREENVR